MQNRSPRRRMLAVALSAALVTSAVAGAATGVARPARHATTPRASHGRTVFVVEHAITDTEIPLNGTDGKGNPLTFNNPVYNRADTRQVGHDEGFCERIQPQLGIWECLWTTFVHGGQLTVQGPYYDTRNSVLSVTGGTGRYDGARGEMTLISRNGGKEYDFIFHLLGR